jgi:hypothetical protein
MLQQPEEGPEEGAHLEALEQKKAAANSSSRKRVAADVATTSAVAPPRGSSRRRNYRTGPGSAYWLLVRDEQQGKMLCLI